MNFLFSVPIEEGSDYCERFVTCLEIARKGDDLDTLVDSAGKGRLVIPLYESNTYFPLNSTEECII